MFYGLSVGINECGLLTIVREKLSILMGTVVMYQPVVNTHTKLLIGTVFSKERPYQYGEFFDVILGQKVEMILFPNYFN